MAVCDYQPLLDEGKCFMKNAHIQLVLEVQMLCNLLDKIVNAGFVTCDPNTLLSQGACFVALPDQALRAIKLQLLCEISSAL